MGTPHEGMNELIRGRRDEHEDLAARLLGRSDDETANDRGERAAATSTSSAASDTIEG